MPFVLISARPLLRPANNVAQLATDSAVEMTNSVRHQGMTQSPVWLAEQRGFVGRIQSARLVIRCTPLPPIATNSIQMNFRSIFHCYLWSCLFAVSAAFQSESIAKIRLSKSESVCRTLTVVNDKPGPSIMRFAVVHLDFITLCNMPR